MHLPSITSFSAIPRSADDVEDVGTRVDIVRDKKSDLDRDKQREGLAEFVAKLRHQDADARPAQRLDRLDLIPVFALDSQLELTSDKCK